MNALPPLVARTNREACDPRHKPRPTWWGMLGSKRSAMAQRSSTCTLTRAADAPSDGHIHLVAPALALGMAAIGFVASDKPSLRTNLPRSQNGWVHSPRLRTPTAEYPIATERVARM